MYLSLAKPNTFTHASAWIDLNMKRRNNTFGWLVNTLCTVKVLCHTGGTLRSLDVKVNSLIESEICFSSCESTTVLWVHFTQGNFQGYRGGYLGALETNRLEYRIHARRLHTCTKRLHYHYCEWIFYVVYIVTPSSHRFHYVGVSLTD